MEVQLFTLRFTQDGLSVDELKQKLDGEDAQTLTQKEVEVSFSKIKNGFAVLTKSTVANGRKVESINSLTVTNIGVVFRLAGPARLVQMSSSKRSFSKTIKELSVKEQKRYSHSSAYNVFDAPNFPL